MSTKYLQEKLIFLYAKKGKSKGYAFLNVPDHVYSEIVKLNGVEFESNPLVLEKAKKKQTTITIVHQINKSRHIINSQIIT